MSRHEFHLPESIAAGYGASGAELLNGVKHLEFRTRYNQIEQSSAPTVPAQTRFTAEGQSCGTVKSIVVEVAAP
jgi:hypothetical protein